MRMGYIQVSYPIPNLITYSVDIAPNPLLGYDMLHKETVQHFAVWYTMSSTKQQRGAKQVESGLEVPRNYVEW